MTFYINDYEQGKLREWWQWLDENRGDRAVLRRANGCDEILLLPAFAHFLSFMPEDWCDGSRMSIMDVALLAGILARVKEDKKEKSLAKSLAQPKEKGGKAVMSELRFQQLQKSRNEDEFYTRLRRAVDLIGGKLDIVLLASDIFHWLHEYRTAPARNPQQRLAVRWASDYYCALND